MAKKSKIAKNEQRKVIVERYAAKRAELKKTLVDENATDEAREAARLGLQKLPRDASPVRLRNRDQIDGRPRGTLQKFGISRVRFREMPPGVFESAFLQQHTAQLQMHRKRLLEVVDRQAPVEQLLDVRDRRAVSAVVKIDVAPNHQVGRHRRRCLRGHRARRGLHHHGGGLPAGAARTPFRPCGGGGACRLARAGRSGRAGSTGIGFQAF